MPWYMLGRYGASARCSYYRDHERAELGDLHRRWRLQPANQHALVFGDRRASAVQSREWTGHSVREGLVSEGDLNSRAFELRRCRSDSSWEVIIAGQMRTTVSEGDLIR